MLPKSTQAKQHFVYREWEHISKLVANLSTKQLRYMKSVLSSYHSYLQHLEILFQIPTTHNLKFHILKT